MSYAVFVSPENLVRQEHPKYGADRPDLIVLSSIGVVFWIAFGDSGLPMVW